MTTHALPRCRFVEKHSFPIHISKTFVTEITINFNVRALQRKVCPCLMVEK